MAERSRKEPQILLQPEESKVSIFQETKEGADSYHKTIAQSSVTKIKGNVPERYGNMQRGLHDGHGSKRLMQQLISFQRDPKYVGSHAELLTKEKWNNMKQSKGSSPRARFVPILNAQEVAGNCAAPMDKPPCNPGVGDGPKE